MDRSECLLRLQHELGQVPVLVDLDDVRPSPENKRRRVLAAIKSEGGGQ